MDKQIEGSKQRGRPKKTWENPFIINDLIRTNIITIVSKQKRYTSAEGGVVYLDTPIDKDAQFVHLNSRILIDLSKKQGKLAESSMFIYIVHKLKVNSDEIELIPEKIELETGYSTDKIKRSISKLCVRKILAKKIRTKKDHIFYINPIYLFKGNRYRFIKEKYGEEAASKLFQVISSQ